MVAYDGLTAEISKRIMMDVGIVPNQDFGSLGISEKSFMLQRQLKVKYDDGVREHNIYYAKMKLADSVLRGMLFNLSVDDSYEFLFVFRMDALPVYAIRWDVDDEFFNFIQMYKDEAKSWVNTSVHMKATLLANFEQIVSYGVLWEDCTDDMSDLYDAALKLIG
jgi:hypothetical protein